MNRRVLLAGVLGGIAMFVWSSVAHMGLPLGEAGVQQIAGEAPLLASMQSTLKGNGFYVFPNMPSGDHAEYTAKVASGPSGILVYADKRQVAMGPMLGAEFGSELMQALIA